MAVIGNISGLVLRKVWVTFVTNVGSNVIAGLRIKELERAAGWTAISAGWFKVWTIQMAVNEMNRSQTNFFYLGMAVMLQRNIRAVVRFGGWCAFEDSTYRKKSCCLYLTKLRFWALWGLGQTFFSESRYANALGCFSELFPLPCSRLPPVLAAYIIRGLFWQSWARECSHNLLSHHFVERSNFQQALAEDTI